MKSLAAFGSAIGGSLLISPVAAARRPRRAPRAAQRPSSPRTGAAPRAGGRRRARSRTSRPVRLPELIAARLRSRALTGSPTIRAVADERIWAPWRLEYVKDASKEDRKSVV